MLSKENLNQLKNENLAKVGLFKNTLWLCFGDEITQLSEFGIPTIIYPYTLHINCSWRISERKEIVFAKQDMFTENNVRDSIMIAINEKLQRDPVFVEVVEVNEFSDVKIILSNEMRVDIFLDTSINNDRQLKFFNQNKADLDQNENAKHSNSAVSEPAAEDFEKKPEVIDKKSGVLISQIFESSAYGLFREFCKCESLIYVNNITDDHLSKFRRTQGVGQKRYLDVVNRMEKFGYKEFESSEPIDFVLENIPKDILVSQVFRSSTYRFFREFCKRENLIYINDITNEHLMELSNTQGVGQKKYSDIINKLKEITVELKELEVKNFTAGKIYEYVKNLNLSDILLLLKIEDIKFSDAKLFELEGRALKELEHISEVENLIKLSNKLSQLQSPRDTLTEFKSQLKESQQLIIKMRILEEKTLEEVGHELNVTRERARQIERKIKQKIRELFLVKRLNDSFILISGEVNHIKSKDLATILGEENKDVFKLLKMNDTPLYYNHEFDIFFFKELDLVEFQERVALFLAELPEIFRINEYEHLFAEILPSSDKLLFESVYDRYNFKKYGEFYSSRKLNPVDILNLLYKYYVTELIKLDVAGTARIVEMAQIYFEYELPNEMRSIDARARDSEQLILVDRLTYQWFDPTTIDDRLLTEILDYLNNEFQTREFVNTEQVFSKFKNQLDEQQIFNKIHLYSVIKYFLDDQLKIGKGNTLNIYPDENSKMSVEEKIVALIKKDGGVTTKTKIQQTTHWTMFRIDQIISQSNQIVALEKDEVRLFKTIELTNEIKNELLELISICMTQGFTTTAIILKEIAKISHLNDFVNNNELSSFKTIASFIKIIYPKIKGHTLYLYNDSNSEKTFEEALVRIIDDMIDRQSLLNKIQEYGYSLTMSSIIINKILDRGLFVEIDRGIYVPAYKLDISVEVVEKLNEFIETQLQGNEYLSLDKFNDFGLYLPNIEYEWTANLIR